MVVASRDLGHAAKAAHAHRTVLLDGRLHQIEDRRLARWVRVEGIDLWHLDTVHPWTTGAHIMADEGT